MQDKPEQIFCLHSDQMYQEYLGFGLKLIEKICSYFLRFTKYSDRSEVGLGGITNMNLLRIKEMLLLITF